MKGGGCSGGHCAYTPKQPAASAMTMDERKFEQAPLAKRSTRPES
eukprot:CAMPEP_0117003204 /NCGR_PEP_ID=MMETSP0472-20121206/4595_1 /TAXON_ID=693140 ORGANISM="Tiarina fusus, Strain LIS" /NCGR_SAMPLE_ID=MMETSP0472 /ASSEMBLY_ACC=CAM_ASM_000603 /LENGTH=44 /DNA_ID= /DNA_START= /DNA_END= /DNA_ORIENTATION=